MRIGLAVGIVLFHSIVTSYGGEFQHALFVNPLIRPPLAALLAMFFSLSGFLVAGSLERCRTLVSFAGLRVMRIFPALVVETLLSAFILGPLLTQVSLPDYFGGSEFRLYMLNMLGFPHIFLPGLFAHNPATYFVNGQLWTVPYELRCYQVLLVIAAVGCYANKWAHLAVVSLLTLAVAVFVNPIRLESLAGNMLVLCFLWGTLWFRYRATIPWSGALAIVAAVVSAAALSIRGGDVVATASLSYLTVYLGLLNPPRNRLLFSGDYSYGLFLYGFPVQQAIATWGSGLGDVPRHPQPVVPSGRRGWRTLRSKHDRTGEKPRALSA